MSCQSLVYEKKKKKKKKKKMIYLSFAELAHILLKLKTWANSVV